MSNLPAIQKNGSVAKNSNFADFPQWNNWIDNIFNMEPILMSNFNKGMTLPKVNIRETADAYFVDMAVPGFAKSDFVIDLEKQVLSVSVEHDKEKNEVNENYTRKEFGYASFKRTFTLPDTIDDEHINATYMDGILSIHIPKREEAKQKPPRKIPIV